MPAARLEPRCRLRGQFGRNIGSGEKFGVGEDAVTRRLRAALGIEVRDALENARGAPAGFGFGSSRRR